MNSSSKRVAAVTGGLMVAGAILGGLASTLGFTIATFLIWSVVPPLIAWGVVFTGGALLGAVLLPATGLLLMRRVPLWLSFLGTTAGALIGGILGTLVSTIANGVYGPLGALAPLLGAVIGFFLAVIRLRSRYAAPRDGVRVQAPTRP